MYNLRGIKWKLNPSRHNQSYVDKQRGVGEVVVVKKSLSCPNWAVMQEQDGCKDEFWTAEPIIRYLGVGSPDCWLLCWQVHHSVTLLWADTVFISSCCLQQDQTVTHSYKLWWYMAPIIPHLDIKTLTCEQNKGWPCTSSCTVSIKMTDGEPQPRFPNITSKIFSFQFHSAQLKNSGIMDTRRSLRINIFDYPL